MSEKVRYPVTLPTNRPVIQQAYSQEFRHYVYQIWLYVANRSLAHTIRLLADPAQIPESIDIDTGDPESMGLDLREPVTLHRNTLSTWVKIEDWHTRANDELRSISPAIWDVSAQTILIGAREAITYLRGVANGSEPLNKESRTRVLASQLLIDRAGFQPWARSTRSEPIDGPKDDFTDSFAGMETHELARALFEAATGQHPATNDSDPSGV